ncbi:hypothetical protein SRABI98_00737 [Microbacterium sp. Bi98]|uniref:alginate lyase family protein n=1 Tax=Microbacterium sp. Bi98 TaxID=2821116 RepID=UPI001DF7801C|nr:alginate lyase family protein [Microbacterium sp. Bi98]CAH0148966.1 hypothetical protein SRABI98_00737 [Microbacterium sp. Bi98]
MKIKDGRGRPRRAIVSMVLAVVLGAAVMTPVSATAETRASATMGSLPQIVRTESDSGFAHPGVGVTADNLENMREQVAAGVEPWASYYDAMTHTKYGSSTYRASNSGSGLDEPRDDSYDEAGMRGMALDDSIGAMTQALQYVVTGEEVYRANALHVIRTWSGLDPAKYQYFADAHIHTGVPLYQMLVAAEIIRSTTTADAYLDGYDLQWTEADEQRLEANFIRPNLETFLYSQNRLWNQHLYGVIGMVAAAIYLDDADLYAQRVEWFTVNASYESEHTINGGDVNGSLSALYRIISKNDPLNTFKKSFVQHMEMGRDQAHAEGDTAILTALARIINNQGTTLDPVDGTVSTARNAVSPYEFLDNRILAGGDVFAAFMLGEEVPYIDTSGGSGKLSQAYRGRLRDPLGELYLQYKYVADVNVERKAPHVAEVYEHRDGPLYYYGNSVENFWNPRGSDFTGAEYWVAFPAELAADGGTAPPAQQQGPELSLSQFGHMIGKGAKQQVDDGVSFVRLKANKKDAQVAVRRTVWSNRATTSLVGIRVRTNDSAVLQATRTSRDEPFAEIRVPDTDGEWRTVWMDLDQAAVSAPVGDNILFLRATGSKANVDVAGVLSQAGSVLTPPKFDVASPLHVVAVAGEPWTRSFVASDSAGDNLQLALQDAPKGVTLSGDIVSWTPGTKKKDIGEFNFLVVASDSTTDTALSVTVTVVPDREAAIDALLADAGEPQTFTTSSWAPVEERRIAATDAIPTADAAAFGELLDQLRVAVKGLELLNPQLSDGSLDFSEVTTSPTLAKPILVALTDGDNQTTWGDQRVPEILLDFGPAYRVRAEGFGFLARDTFADRTAGTNVYGSDDGSSWTLLTEHPTVGDDVAIEDVPVRAQAREDRFRFLKLQMDEPGAPGEPWSIADLRIRGERSEAVGSMSSVSLASPDGIAGRILPSDTVELRFTGDAGNNSIAATILGEPAEVVVESPGSWLARLVVPDSSQVGTTIPFSIDFATPDGRQADRIAATTDGSKLYLSSDVGIVDDIFIAAPVVGPTGQPDAALTSNAAKMFDASAATASDTRAINGVFAMTWDLDDAPMSLTAAEILVRQDGYGTSRISNMRLEGSNDLSTWTRLTPVVPQGTLDWQPWEVTDDTGYRYIRLVNGQIINIAELRLFGTTD